MKRVALLAVLVAAVVPSTAHASVPCRVRIYNDWYADGKIASSYPLGCYRDALKHVPPDARIYSNLVDDVKAALRAAQERAHGDTKVPAQVGKGDTTAGGVLPATATLHRTKAANHTITKSRSNEPVSNTSPSQMAAIGQPASSSGGIPTPIIVLGALALLLAAIGAAGAGVRHHRRRDF